LAAYNDGPTMENQATSLWATITTGSDVNYSWDFGDLTPQGQGNPTNHVYTSEGVYTATVTASNDLGQQQATTQVTIEQGVLLESYFESDADFRRWTPFLNYWRLYDESLCGQGQWYWDPSNGVNSSGAATNHHNPCDHHKKEAEDALLMYLAEGAEEWTDYRLEAKINIRTDSHPQGLWVRGQYEDVGDDDTAGWVTGYYIMIGGGADKDRHYVSLKQLQTLEDCWGNACNNPHNLYDFNNPHELTITKADGRLHRWAWHTVVVEVRGANIKVWLNGVPYIDYTDEKEPFLTGTVGLKVYKAHTVSFDDVIVTPLQPTE
jgi:PKD repeat protein